MKKNYYVIYKLQKIPGLGCFECEADHKQHAKEIFINSGIKYTSIIKVLR